MNNHLQAPLFGAGPVLDHDADDDFEDFLIPDPTSFSNFSSTAVSNAGLRTSSIDSLTPSNILEGDEFVSGEPLFSSPSFEGSRSAMPAAPPPANSAGTGVRGAGGVTENGAGTPAGTGRSRRTSAKAASARISAAIDADRAQPPAKRARGAAELGVANASDAAMGAGHGSGSRAGKGRAGAPAHGAAAPTATSAAAYTGGGMDDMSDSDLNDELGDDDDDDDMDDSEEDGEGQGGAGTKRKRRQGDPDQRLARSRERNRVHARKSRLRKKFFVDSLKANLEQLEAENRRLRAFLEAKTGLTYEQLQAEQSGAAVPSSTSSMPSSAAGVSSSGPSSSVLAGPGQQPSALLEGGDYALMEALTTSQQNFVISDPTLPDNPIVFASAGFYELTGFAPPEVIGRNCRFLQGPMTDPDAIAAIRQSIAAGRDCAVCIINYKKDNTPFWNRFFVAPLRGVDGKIVNFVGVQCEVKPNVANALINLQGGVHKEFPTTGEQEGAGANAAPSTAVVHSASTKGAAKRR